MKSSSASVSLFVFSLKFAIDYKINIVSTPAAQTQTSRLNLCDWQLVDQDIQQGEAIIPVFRDALKLAYSRLKQHYHDKVPANELVVQRASLVDHTLTRAWHHFIGSEETNIALIAVGGYGRGELHPASDIDLLLLLRGNHHDKFAERIREFLTFLWDIGLEVGQSVRTVKECVAEAKRDITVVTNLMEARLLCGPTDLFTKLADRVGPNKIWRSAKFYKAKVEEQIERHKRYNDSAYNLEPNIKENPGGLRDIQVIGWVVKRHFGATTLHDLVGHGFITEREHHNLIDSQNFLWKIRTGLHFLTGRREDRLLFDHQRTLATEFGYRDDENRLAVEKFMKDYYRTVMELNRLNEMLLQLFDEVILNRRARVKLKPINKRFRARNGFVEVVNPNIFKHYPFALLEIFLVLAQHKQLKGVRAETIRLIRDHRYLIDDKFRNDVRCHSLFMEIFRQPVGLTHELQRMNRYGILAAYLPVFGNIVGQMQHDLFHVYTVDEHTMFLVRNLRRFMVPEHAHEFPLCSSIAQRIPKPELLYLAAFFHDIAKGRGGDHSELGALDAVTFCKSHGLSQYDTNLVAWLVKNHLRMSTTAQRKDISDPQIIKEFAQLIGSQDRLNYLYLLTVADIRATNPNLWNSWKDSLLAELYVATTKAFQLGLENSVDTQQQIDAIKDIALSRLLAQKFSETEVLTFWESIEDDYFIRYSSDEIAWHTQAFLRSKKKNFPLVLIREQTHRGGTELFVCAKDEKYVFALTTAAIGKLGLTVIDARIITSNAGYTLDTFIVLEQDGNAIRGEIRIAEITAKIRELLEQPNYEKLINNQPKGIISRRLKHFPISTEVIFGTDTKNLITTMEVITRDRPGLLAHIAMALVESKAQIINARIATFGERAEDIFILTDDEGGPIQSVQLLEKLKSRIIELLDD